MTTCLVLAVGLVLSAVADDPVPADLIDPGFERLIDLRLLRTALDEGKPDLLADCALQLAEGERVLFRRHKAVSADKVFRLAARLAVEQRDKDTLARLGRAAKAAKHDDLVALIESAEKLAARPRVADAVSLDNVTAEQAVVYRSLAEQVRTAKSLSNRGQLDALDKSIRKMDDFDAKLRTALLKQVADARAALPDKEDAEMDVLSRLASSSRAAPAGILYYTVRITLKNTTSDVVRFDYATRAGQQKPDPIGAKQSKAYTLQFLKGKPAHIALEKGRTLLVQDGATYEVTRGEGGYTLMP